MEPPGSGLSISTEGLKAKEVAPPTLIDVFLNIVPINPIEALSKGNMLQIIFFALLFGFGLSVIGDKGKQVLHFFDGAADVMIKVTGFVMLYAPIGVFGLMAYTVSMHGLSVLLPLIKLVLVMYLACILQILIVYLPCVKITGLTPSRFLKGLASPMMIAFTTCSSAAALSTTLLSVQKLGASPVVRDGDQAVHVLAELGDALLRGAGAFRALKQERFGHDAHRQGSQFAGGLCHDGGRAADAGWLQG